MTPIEQKAAEAVAIYLNPDIDEASKYVAMARVMAELQAAIRAREAEAAAPPATQGQPTLPDFTKMAGELHDQVHEAAALVSWPDQKDIGWAPEEAIPILADALMEAFNLGRAISPSPHAPLTAEEAVAGAAQIDRNLSQLFPSAQGEPQK